MMDARGVFNVSEGILGKMQADGLSGEEIARVLVCAVVQTCLNAHDAILASQQCSKEIERLAKENLTYLLKGQRKN
jgi:hypothetical protein